MQVDGELDVLVTALLKTTGPNVVIIKLCPLATRMLQDKARYERETGEYERQVYALRLSGDEGPSQQEPAAVSPNTQGASTQPAPAQLPASMAPTGLQPAHPPAALPPPASPQTSLIAGRSASSWYAPPAAPMGPPKLPLAPRAATLAALLSGSDQPGADGHRLGENEARFFFVQLAVALRARHERGLAPCSATPETMTLHPVPGLPYELIKARFTVSCRP